ncbi:MAG: YgeY family selenium metabolism-linked hydrolase [Caldilineae bacterium]|nr:MAG: YgeY family selenium metabolism-linked hydrolase [Caldilineae bacterium]
MFSLRIPPGSKEKTMAPSSPALTPRFQRSHWDETRAQACIDFLKRLVQTPSLSGQESAVARMVAAEMRDLGYPGVRVDRIGNVIGRCGRPGGPILLFNAHMDTVDIGDPGAWTHDPYGAEIEQGRLYGRGAADMKGALAAMVHGIGLLARHQIDLPGEVIVAAVVQEEPTEGMAMRVLVEEEGIRPHWVILGEPTNLQIARGHRGRMEIRLSTFGRSCHASAPQQGENALYSAARVIFGIELLNSNLMTDAVLGQGTIAVTHLSSVAGGRNVIPDRCDLIIDRRLTLGETASRALAEIEALLRRENIRGEVQTGYYRTTSYTGYSTEGPEVYPAWLMPEDHPLLTHTINSLEQTLGRRPTVGVWAFSTDGTYTMGTAGIPTIGFGPGDDRLAHTADESIRLEDIHTAAVAYANLAVDLLHHLPHP